MAGSRRGTRGRGTQQPTGPTSSPPAPAPTQPQTPTATIADPLFGGWLGDTATAVGIHHVVCFEERAGARSAIHSVLKQLVSDHYVDPNVTAQRLVDLGAPITARLLREAQPTTKRARSGDVGEVLATEFVERRLGYRVPVRRLRYKDGREMALRGDDIVAVVELAPGQLLFLKGESKSRVALTPTVIGQAADGLDKDDGRPNRHSVVFVATRLRELGSQADQELAKQLELAVTQGFRGHKIEHLLFILCGNDAQQKLLDHVATIRRRRTLRRAIAIRIDDHQAFIASLY